MFGKSNNKEYLAMKAQFDDKVNELAMAEKRIGRLQKETDEQKSTIETMAAKHSVEFEELKSKLAKTEKSVASKVNCALASLGVSNFAVETIYSASNTTPQEALKKFLTLTGAAKTEYYNENKELITQALSSQKINQG